MTAEDFNTLMSFAREMPEIRSIGVCSPIDDGEKRIFPNAKALPRWRWDLNRPTRKRFDLVVAANVFMYSPDPSRWFRNVFASSRYFLLLDLVRRQRGENSEFGVDGDCMRFAIGPHVPRVPSHYDLNSLSGRIIAQRAFKGGQNENDDEPLHFLALFRGDLANPLIRIDDYPTGIRPILDDLSPLHEILERVESYGLAYNLGIVPDLLTPDMLSFLRSLKHMVPAMHGYDHAYHKYAPTLLESGDPYNQKTVGVFDEFKDLSYDKILGRLKKGRRMIEDGLGKAPDTYIPPCNIGNRKTGRALLEAGFNRYLSEKKIRGCELPWIKSDFYGQSSKFRKDQENQVVSLHVTWEWDLIRQGHEDSLTPLLEHLAAEARREQARADALAVAVLTEPVA